jgi:Bacterial regulatory helix-turn-helix protein, lysR family
MIRNIDVAVARAFLAVVETDSVTLAARQLNLTQGAPSASKSGDLKSLRLAASLYAPAAAWC